MQEYTGTDGAGQTTSSSQLWQQVKDADGGHSQWYSKAVDYWDQQEASYDGVLGGYGHLSDVDIRDSKQLLKKALRDKLAAASTGTAKLTSVDCGAGVGRVTEQLLLNFFHTVDMVEPSQHLLDTAKDKLANPQALGFPAGHRLGQLICCGLQDFTPAPARYDCIWVQWCLLYLTDEHLVAFLERCKPGLTEGGVVVVKENVCTQGFIVDPDDSSLTRSNEYLLDLFSRANMQVLYNMRQKDFPETLYGVRMYVLKPRAPKPAA